MLAGATRSEGHNRYWCRMSPRLRPTHQAIHGIPFHAYSTTARRRRSVASWRSLHEGSVA